MATMAKIEQFLNGHNFGCVYDKNRNFWF